MLIIPGDGMRESEHLGGVGPLEVHLDRIALQARMPQASMLLGNVMDKLRRFVPGLLGHRDRTFAEYRRSLPWAVTCQPPA